MKLYEFEGHNILKKVGIDVPNFVVVSDIGEVKQALKRLKLPVVAKVQVLSGKRGKSGGVKVCKNESEVLDFAKENFAKDFGGEKTRFIALAEKVNIESEYYISITYDTVLKIPFLLFSENGGVDIEELTKESPTLIKRLNIDPFTGPTKKNLEALFRGRTPDKLVDFALRLWDAFWRYDCRLVEVNPLARVKSNVILERSDRISSSSTRSRSYRSLDSLQDDNFVAIDAKIILDDSGLLRHKDLDVLPKGSASAVPTEREIVAREIDSEDYRGTAGSTFIELGGDLPAGEASIAILASGGGASLLVMDAVVDAGGSPANYTEYSGNPPAEKVEKLTKITLNKEGLSGCLVAGAVANFTDIYETLRGFVEGLRQVKPKPMYPIVIRRGGPRQKEAYEMLEKVAKKEGYDFYLFGPETPISVASRKMVELARDYASRSQRVKASKRN